MKSNIEAERARRHMTQKEIASALGITVNTYSGYVRGRKPIPSNILIALSQMFSCSTDYLLGLTAGDKSA